MRNDILKLIYKCFIANDNHCKITDSEWEYEKHTLFSTRFRFFGFDKKEMRFKIVFDKEPPIVVSTRVRDSLWYRPYAEITCGALVFELTDIEYKALYKFVKDFDEKRLADFLQADLELVRLETVRRLEHYDNTLLK